MWTPALYSELQHVLQLPDEPVYPTLESAVTLQSADTARCVTMLADNDHHLRRQACHASVAQ